MAKRVDGTIWNDTLSTIDVPPGSAAEFHGGGGDDHLSGTELDDLLFGDDGNDTLVGGAGNDELYGGAGDDDVSGGSGNDKIVANIGVDTVSGGGGNDDITVHGGDWFRFDRVDGGSGNDEIAVHGSKIVAHGGSGNDTIHSDLGKDTVLTGGAGNDRFVLTDGAVGSGAVAHIHGGEAAVAITSAFGFESIATEAPTTDTGTDTIDLAAFGSADVVWIDLLDGTLMTTDYENVTSLLAEFAGIENVVGSAGRDIVDGNGADNEIDSGAGDDIVDGGAGDDTLRGGGGGDSIKGGGDDDLIYAGSGNDYLYGGSGIDVLFGESGADTLYGDGQDDYLDGGSGNDKLYGGTGFDVLLGGAGDDTLEGGGDADQLAGGAGADTIKGGSGADVIYGDLDGDGVYADRLTGGSGADEFHFVDVAKTIVGTNGTTVITASVMDTITDFDSSGTDHDVIDLHVLLQNKTSFNYQNGAQAAIDQGYVYFVQHGTPGQADFGTKVMVDLNGGAHGDAANNYAVVDLQGIFASEMRADLFFM